MNSKQIRNTITLFITCAIFVGCTIPCDVYFRNFTNTTIRLDGTLVSRWKFERLPNKVNFYNTAADTKKILGYWKYQRLLTWKDSVNFSIDIPAATTVNLSDVSTGMTLGSHYLDVLLIATSGAKSDTIATGDYTSILAKFKSKPAVFSRPLYYYDMR